MSSQEKFQSSAYTFQYITPRQAFCIENFEQEMSSHVKRNFNGTFRYQIDSSQDLIWIKNFLKEGQIRYRVVTEQYSKKSWSMMGGWSKSKTTCYSLL